MFFLTIAMTLWVIVKLPKDYFSSPRKEVTKKIGLQSVAIKIARNCLAVVLIVSGVVMLVLPGQGLLTILIGVIVMDTSYKHHLEAKLMQQAKIKSALNKIRKRYNKQPFV